MENKVKKTLTLVELTVESFTTSLDKDEQKKVRGGSESGNVTFGTTSIPIFCL